jgi:hypothetical protein
MIHMFQPPASSGSFFIRRCATIPQSAAPSLAAPESARRDCSIHPAR